MEIRAATLKDAPFISALLRELTGRFIAHELSEEAAGRLLESMDEAAIREYMASGCRYRVAEENGEVIGVAAVKDNSRLFHLFVAEGFQRKGLARRLWDVARETCLRAGNPGVFTTVSGKASRPESRKRRTRPCRTETIVPPGFPERGTAGIDSDPPGVRRERRRTGREPALP